MRLIDVGGLAVRLTGGEDGEGGGDGPLVVLCHGFGAPGDDLVGLAEYVEVDARVRFAFPAAPLSLGAGYGGGRAWWMLDTEAIQRAHEAGRRRDARGEVPAGLAEARAALTGVLDRLAPPGTTLILGGFSQGAMLACDLALRDRRPIAALALLSGTFLAADDWRAGMPARAGLPVLQSHGTADPLLPFSIAEILRDELAAAGLRVDFVAFEGGHEIPAVVLDRLGRLIRRAAGGPPAAPRA